jgi:hypothetical protein
MIPIFADCRLSANCLPTETNGKPYAVSVFMGIPVGNPRLLLPSCQLPKDQRLQGFPAVGKSATSLLLLRSNAAARISGSSASYHFSPSTKGRTSHER